VHRYIHRHRCSFIQFTVKTYVAFQQIRVTFYNMQTEACAGDICRIGSAEKAGEQVILVLFTNANSFAGNTAGLEVESPFDAENAPNNSATPIMKIATTCLLFIPICTRFLVSGSWFLV